MADSIDSLFDRIAGARGDRPLPPVDRWHPAHQGDSRMRIAADGRWYYCNSEIRRPEMVRLFSTVLRRDADGFVLVTPAEKLTIEVEDAPFVAIDFERRGDGDAQELAFATNVGDVVIASASHPLRVRGSADAPRPYIDVRQGLEALLARPVYYRLVDIATERDDASGRLLGVWSAGIFFPIGYS